MIGLLLGAWSIKHGDSLQCLIMYPWIVWTWALLAVKEIARGMSKPLQRTWKALLRIGRYLQKVPRRPYFFRWQDEPQKLFFTDSNWAGCERSRRSTSGGVMYRGSHVVKHWSRTQAAVALSSAEAELAALIKGSTEVLGARNVTCVVRWENIWVPNFLRTAAQPRGQCSGPELEE